MSVNSKTAVLDWNTNYTIDCSGWAVWGAESWLDGVCWHPRLGPTGGRDSRRVWSPRGSATSSGVAWSGRGSRSQSVSRMGQHARRRSRPCDVSAGAFDGSLASQPLWAYSVTNTDDNLGAGTLRTGITQANGDTDEDYIDFSIYALYSSFLWPKWNQANWKKWIRHWFWYRMWCHQFI